MTFVVEVKVVVKGERLGVTRSRTTLDFSTTLSGPVASTNTQYFQEGKDEALFSASDLGLLARSSATTQLFTKSRFFKVTAGGAEYFCGNDIGILY
jgi:hypothetical protein